MEMAPLKISYMYTGIHAPPLRSLAVEDEIGNLFIGPECSCTCCISS